MPYQHNFTNMTLLKRYQWATAILGVLVVVLGIWLISATHTPAAASLDDAHSALADCSENIGKWRAQYPGGATTLDAQNALSGILNQCANSIK